MSTVHQSATLVCLFTVLLASALDAQSETGEKVAKFEKVEQGQPASAQILESLRFPDDVEVGFTQSQINPLIKRVSSQSGVMVKSARNGLVMRVTEPRFEERIINQGVLTLRRESRRRKSSDLIERHVQLDATRPSHLVLLALEALLNGKLEILESHFQLEVVTHDPASEETWQITLIPHTQAVREQLSSMNFFGHQHQLTRFRTERHNARGDLSHWLDVQIQPPV